MEKRMTSEIQIFNQMQNLCANTRIPDKALWSFIDKWGANSHTAARKNPFLLADCDGIGFGSADTIRTRLQLPYDFPPRLACGVETVLATAASGHGHVCLPRWLLVNDSVNLLGKEQIKAQTIEQTICKMNNFDRLEFSGEMVYLKRFHREEQYLSEAIRALQRSLVVPIEPDLSDLAVDQIQAVQMIAQHPVAILTGPPGTGKTFTIKRIIDSIPGDLVALAAPTGKAAKRMMELTGRYATTMHRLLEAFLDDGRFVFARDQDLPIDKKVIVLDEASMIDSTLAYYFLQAVEEGTRLILVGDIDQLPPVGPGNFLRDLIASGVVPCASLTTIKRQDPGLIIQSCHAIREGNPPSCNIPNTENVWECPLSGGDVWILKINEESRILDAIKHLVTITLPKMGYDPLKHVQLLSPYRSKTGLSCQVLNDLLQACFTMPGDKNLKYRVGDKVIQTRNDYALGIINGDIGYIVNITYESMGLFEGYGRATYHVAFENPYRLVSIPAKDHDLQLAYCVTCHKYQGSEIEVVIIPIHETFGDWFVQRNWLYTAVSRAKKLCILIGQTKEIPKIVKLNKQKRRYTRLAEILRSQGENQ